MSSPNTVQGLALGASLAFPTTADVSLFEVGTVVPLGTTVYALATNDYWQLKVSATGPDGTHLAVAGLSGLRWIKAASGGTVNSVVAGTGISVDSSDPTAPVVAVKTGAGTRLTASGNVSALDFTGLTGSTDGNYILTGEWVAGAGGDTELELQVNGIASAYSNIGVFGASTAGFTNTGNFGGTDTTTGYSVCRAGGAAGRSNARFVINVSGVTAAGNCYVSGRCEVFNGSTGQNFQAFMMDCVIPIAGQVTELKFITKAGTATILSGSYAVLQKTGISA